jgi:type II secretory pathway component PulF
MIEKIKKYEKQIRQLKKDAKEMLQYPWLYLTIQYTENIQI